MNLRTRLLRASVLFVMASSESFAGGCDTYPAYDGLEVESTEAGLKILSTASATVYIDDPDEVNDALREAQLYAKAEIASFLGETIQTEESIDKAVGTTVKISGDQKEINKEVVKVKLQSVSQKASSLLRGVVRLGECYTKGQVVKVTVGVKDETISAANKTADAMTEKKEVKRSGNTAPSSANGTEANGGVNDFSRSSKLDKF